MSAALGWTIPATPASGTTPAIATWTKPANVPYLNLFCDPRAYTCNSADTLDYLHGIDEVQEYMHVKERGIKADGPLFDLPGGTVKMAVGANYDHLQLPRPADATRVQPTRSSTLSRIRAIARSGPGSPS